MRILEKTDLSHFSKLFLRSCGTLIYADSSYDLYQLPEKYHRIGMGFNTVLAANPKIPVVKANFDNFSATAPFFHFGASISLKKAIYILQKNSCHCLDSLYMIPGSLGGAIFMNAGTKFTSIGDFVKNVSIFQNQKSFTISSEDCKFSYRNSIFQNQDLWITDITLKCAGNCSKKEIPAKRTVNSIQLPNLGSTFRNPPGLVAGKLIEECGLKGLHKNGLEVSHQHANVIINKEKKADLDDFLWLTDKIQNEVYSCFKVKLELEIRIFL